MNWLDFLIHVYRLRDPERLRVALLHSRGPLPKNHPLRVMAADSRRRDATGINWSFANMAGLGLEWVLKIDPNTNWEDCARIARVSLNQLFHAEAAHHASGRKDHCHRLLDLLSSTEFGQRTSLVLPEFAIAIDTESRGDILVELGGATLNGETIEFLRKPALVPRGRQAQQMVKAMLGREWAYVAEQFPLLVFHNADHDLNVLRGAIGWSPPKHTRVWDTMIVGSLLEPWKSTHALPGHTGHASGDAAATFRLFRGQLDILGEQGEPILRKWIASQSWDASRLVLFDQLVECRLMRCEEPTHCGNVVPFADLSEATHWLWTRPVTPRVSRLECGPDSADDCRRIDPLLAMAYIRDHTTADGSTSDSQISAARSLFHRAQREQRGLFFAMLPAVLRHHHLVARAIRDAELPSDDDGLVVAVGRGRLYAATNTVDEQHLIDQVLGKSDQNDMLLDVTHRAVTEDGVPVFGSPGSCEIVDVEGENRLKETRPWRKQSQTVQYSRVTQITPTGVAMDAEVCDWFDEKGDPVGLAEPSSGRRWAYWRDVATALNSLRVAHPAQALVVATREIEELVAVNEFLADDAVSLVNADRWRSRLRHLEAIVEGKEARPVILTTTTGMAAWGRVARCLESDRFSRVRFVFLDLPIEHWCEWKQVGVLPTSEMKRAVKAWLGPWCQCPFGMNGEGKQLPAPIVLDPRLVALMPEVRRRPVQLRRRIDAAYFQAEVRLAQPLGCTSEVATAATRSLQSAVEFLRSHWIDKKEFYRPVQEDAVRALMETDDDLIVSLPTGGGKSLIFQAPALAMSESTLRLNLVLSPLRALMADQVRNIPKSLADRVTMITGDLDGSQAAGRLAGVQDGRYQMVYVAPERLRTEHFQRALLARAARDGGLGLIVFDEAHCITSWGHDFRPDYLKALSWINRHLRAGSTKNCNRVVCLSATMTGMVIDQLKRQLTEGLSDVDSRPVLVCPENPGNPLPEHVRLEPVAAAPIELGEGGRESRYGTILEKLSKEQMLENSVSSAIAFTRRRQDAEDLAELVHDNAKAWRVKSFHAGMHKQDRAEVYEAFMKRDTQVLCATCAFGMGMDIPHVHRSVHLQPPSSPETLVQEAGRIGRDKALRDQAALPGGSCTAFVLHDVETLSDYRTQAGLMRDFQVTLGLVAQVWSKLVNKEPKSGPMPSTWVAIIPETEPLPRPDEAPDANPNTAKRRPNANALRIVLHWLERCGRVELEPGCPTLLELSDIDRSRLTSKGLTDDAKAVATVIRDLHVGTLLPKASAAPTGSSEPAPLPAGRGLGWLLRTALGFLFGTTPAPTAAARQASRAAAPIVARDSMTLNVGDLSRRLGERGAIPSRVIKAVAELEQHGAFRVARELRVQPRRISGDQDRAGWATERLEEAFRLARNALSERSARTRDAWEEWIAAQVEKKHPIPKPLLASELLGMSVDEQKAKKASHADLTIRGNAARRSLGHALKAVLLDPDDGLLQRPRKRRTIVAAVEVEQPVMLRKREGVKAKERLGQTREDSMAVVDSISKSDDASTGSSQAQPAEFSVRLTDLLNACSNSARRLDRTLRLINAAGSWRVERTFVPSCHVMTLTRRKPAEMVLPVEVAHTTSVGSAELGADAPLLELQQQGRLRELQLAALHLLLRLPDSDERTGMLLEYFAARTLGELEGLIERTVASDLTLGSEFELSAVVSAKRKKLFDQAYRNGVDDEKKGIVEAPPDACLLVNAGPGSGKTTLLLWRAAFQLYMGRITDPRGIVLLAFNRAIVAEIRRRVHEELRLLGFGDLGRRIQCLTFDGLVARGLSRVTLDSTVKMDYGERREDFVKQCKADTTLLPATLGQPRLLMVDEAQDMRPPFGELLQLIKAQIPGVGITMVGDDDQDIYPPESGRDGASMMTQMQGMMGMVERCLLNNHRSTKEIVERTQKYIEAAANTKKVTRLKAKVTLLSTRGEGSPWCKVEVCDDFVTFESRAQDTLLELTEGQAAALLVRTNAEVLWWEHWARKKDNRTRGIEAVLRADQLRIGRTRRWHQWSLQLEHMSDDERLDEAKFDELLETYQLKVPEAVDGEAVAHLRAMRVLLSREKPIVRVRDWKRALSEYKCGEWERVRAAEGGSGADRSPKPLVISTLYQAKGLEYDLVLIPPPLGPKHSDGILPHRLLYVAATRAKNRLVLSKELSPPEDKPQGLEQLVLKGDDDEMNSSKFGDESFSREAMNQVPIGSTCDLVPTKDGKKLWVEWQGHRLGFTAASVRGIKGRGRVVEVLVSEYDAKMLGGAPPQGDYPGWHYYPVIASLPGECALPDIRIQTE